MTATAAPEPATAPATAGDPALTHVIIGSPIGPLTLVAAGGGLAGLYMEVRRHGPGPRGRRGTGRPGR